MMEFNLTKDDVKIISKDQSTLSMSSTLDIDEEKKRQLKQLFPEVFCEGVIDFDQLQRVLGKWIDPGKERFGLNWHGKAECIKVAQQPSVGTLKPCREESINFDETNNIFIEGENLEVLKLLQKSYFGKVKMIYIDPPYNTGQDFTYHDDYGDSLKNYLAYTGQIDENGCKFSANSDSSGRYHSKWLNMMYPRLYMARNLLREDGVIFISIDNHEVDHLRKLCDQIFGRENFVECIVWNKRIPKNDKGIGSIHEYILIYLKNNDWDYKFVLAKEGLEETYLLIDALKRKKIPIYEAQKELKKLYNKKNYDRGITLYSYLDEDYKIWGKINLSWPNGNTFGPTYEILHPETNKPVKIPDRGWRWRKETFASYLDNKTIKLHDGSYICGQVWFGRDENTQPSLVRYLEDVNTLLLRSVLSVKSGGGIEIETLLGGKNYFLYPKPTILIKMLADSFCYYRPSDQLQEAEIILDFFAGSGTTAHAVMDLNAEDDGKRKYICVQIPEPCNEKSEALKAGYKTIADIAKERIRRAAKKIAEENPDKVQTLDLGFKVFKLDYSNFKIWDSQTCGIKDLERQLELFIDHINPNSSTEDILYELLLKAGFPLTTRVEKIQIVQRDVYSVEGGKLLICLEKKITPELINALSEMIPCPDQVICLDAGFQGNDQLKVNTVQTFKTRGQAEKREIIFRTI